MSDRHPVEQPYFERACELAAKQAAELFEKKFLTPGEVVELYLSVSIGIALRFSPASDIADHLRTLAQEIEREEVPSDLH